METIDLTLGETHAEVAFNRPHVLNAANCVGVSASTAAVESPPNCVEVSPESWVALSVAICVEASPLMAVADADTFTVVRTHIYTEEFVLR